MENYSGLKDGQKMMVKIYDGTLEGARELLQKTNAQEPYHFDLKTKEIILFKKGIKFRPGDSYYYDLKDDE